MRFEDITAASGVTFRHNRASSGRKYFVETMGSGVAFIDYDNDGKEDLFFVNGAPLPGYKADGPLYPALYHNLGNGRFQDVTKQAGLQFQTYGMGCAVGDYDNDGYNDLYVTSVLGPSHLFHNRGDGTFADVTAQAGVANAGHFGTSAAWVDYNKDGRLDLYVCNYVQYRSVADDLPCFFKAGVRSYCIPFAYRPEGNRLFRNDGNGHFTDVSKEAHIDAPGKSLAVGITDYDGDSWPDIIVANDTTPTQLFHNNGDGTFKDVAPITGIAYGPMGTAKAGMSVDVADDMNNGHLAVAMGNFANEMVGFYRQVQPGLFEERSIVAGLGQPSRSHLTFGTLFLDVDNDGWRDLVLANGHVQDNVELFYNDTSYKQQALLFHNLHGQYEEVGSRVGGPFAEKLVGRGLARGDLDNDGRVDLVITENNGPARIWRNVTERAGHWLEVRLRGVRSNKNGFGSRLALTAGGQRQTAELESGSSYLSQSDQRVHFGLAGATRADQLEIRWPSGTVDVLKDVAADQTLTVQEGSSHPAGPAPAGGRS